MTGASQCFALINHCSVFDLSFAKGAKKKARRRCSGPMRKRNKKKASEGGKSRGETSSNRYAKSKRCHNTFLMKSEINQLHGLLDKSGTSQASRWSQLLRRLIKTERALAHLHVIKRITEMRAPSSGNARFRSEVCKVARGCYTGVTIIFTLSKWTSFQAKKQAE